MVCGGLVPTISIPRDALAILMPGDLLGIDGLPFCSTEP